MNKEEIRKNILKMREEQAKSVKAKKDKKILQNLARCTSFKNAREFFTYLAHRAEVDTDHFIRKFFHTKKIIVPKIKKGAICLYELKDTEHFVKGTFDIREPKFCLLRSEFKKIDVALIPAVAFDGSGHRIGFGGGYFDRLLKKLHCTTIGLAYEFQIIDKVPTYPYDVPVDYIVTEKRIIDCKKSSKR